MSKGATAGSAHFLQAGPYAAMVPSGGGGDGGGRSRLGVSVKMQPTIPAYRTILRGQGCMVRFYRACGSSSSAAVLAQLTLRSPCSSPPPPVPAPSPYYSVLKNEAIVSLRLTLPFLAW